MKVTEHMIEKFFSGECSPAEEEAVVLYFKEHPSELDEVWLRRDSLMDEKYDQKIDERLSEKMLQEVQRTIFVKKLHRRKRAFVISGAAALILLFIGIRYFSGSSKMQQGDIVNTKEVAKIIKTNTSGSIENIVLSDHSVVQLYPQSSLTYLPGFAENKRDIYLSGEAVFKVARDAARPFTVYSNKIATTALGTVFRVKTAAKDIAVTLYEGKVMVRTVQFENGEKYYLTPGNGLSYNIPTKRFMAISNLVKSENPKETESGKKQAADPQSIEFANTTMQYAIDALAQKYNIEIEYSPLDIQHMNIIATIQPGQPVEQVLGNITRINGLTLVKSSPEKYIIRK